MDSFSEVVLDVARHGETVVYGIGMLTILTMATVATIHTARIAAMLALTMGRIVWREIAELVTTVRGISGRH